MKEYDITRLYKKLATHMKSYSCPFCHNTDYSCNKKFTSLYLSDDYHNTSFTTHLPCLVVTCTKCGHVDLFSILTLDKEQDDE